MLEALCRQSSTTLDIVHAEDGPPITQRTSGLEPYRCRLRCGPRSFCGHASIRPPTAPAPYAAPVLAGLRCAALIRSRTAALRRNACLSVRCTDSAPPGLSVAGPLASAGASATSARSATSSQPRRKSPAQVTRDEIRRIICFLGESCASGTCFPRRLTFGSHLSVPFFSPDVVLLPQFSSRFCNEAQPRQQKCLFPHSDCRVPAS
jgi:hypothetical protein